MDLNSDLGESFGAWRLGSDAEMMDYITSANIACGFHAGDPTVMRHTLRLAKQKGIAVGAHPGYPDLAGFGRRAMTLTRDEIIDLLLYQIGALRGLAEAEGLRVAYVKAHGALYNRAERDAETAAAIVEATRLAGPGLSLVASASSAMARAAAEAGLPFVAEVFADRAYEEDGRLTPRGQPGAVVAEPGEVAKRAVEMAVRGEILSTAGTPVRVQAGTICLHGDTPGAPALARAVRTALELAGVRVAAFVRP